MFGPTSNEAIIGYQAEMAPAAGGFWGVGPGPLEVLGLGCTKQARAYSQIEGLLCSFSHSSRQKHGSISVHFSRVDSHNRKNLRGLLALGHSEDGS